MTVLVGVMGTASISVSQGPQPAQSGRILFDTFKGLYVTDASGLQSKQLLKGPPWAAALFRSTLTRCHDGWRRPRLTRNSFV